MPPEGRGRGSGRGQGQGDTGRGAGQGRGAGRGRGTGQGYGTGRDGGNGQGGWKRGSVRSGTGAVGPSPRQRQEDRREPMPISVTRSGRAEGPQTTAATSAEVAGLRRQLEAISRQITGLQEQLSRLEISRRAEAFVPPVAAVDPEACGGCGACESACLEEAIRVEDKVAVVAADECTGCGQCVDACPDNAIAMIAREGDSAVNPPAEKE